MDYEAAAKAAYKDYEGCSDESVEKVWAWETIEHAQRCGDYGVGICAKCSFEETVTDFTAMAQQTIEVALGDKVLLQEQYPNPGDGTALSKEEHDEAHEAWYQVQLVKKQGYLVQVWPKETGNE